MSTLQSRRHIINADVVRRVIHIVVLLGVIVGVRACGGTTSAEDQLGAGTQWFAEKTGLGAVKERWDRSVRPQITAVTSSASESLYRGLSRSLENASAATDQGATFVTDAAGKAVDAMANSVRAVFASGAAPAPPPQSPPQLPAQRPSPPSP